MYVLTFFLFKKFEEEELCFLKFWVKIKSMSEVEAYRRGQGLMAKFSEHARPAIKRIGNEVERMVDEGVPPPLARALAELRVAGRREEARALIRASAAVGQEKADMGHPTEDALTHDQAVKLLRKFHSSRSPEKRRKRKGKRK